MKGNAINFFHRFLEYEVITGKHPGSNMLEYYEAGDNTRYLQLSSSRVFDMLEFCDSYRYSGITDS